MFLFVCLFVYFEIGFNTVTLAVQELDLLSRLALNSGICQPLVSQTLELKVCATTPSHGGSPKFDADYYCPNL